MPSDGKSSYCLWQGELKMKSLCIKRLKVEEKHWSFVIQFQNRGFIQELKKTYF
jgi:hypothetical protein